MRASSFARWLRCRAFFLDWHFFFGRDFVFRLRDAEEPVIEPAHDVLQTLNAVPGLTGARELMRFVRESHHYRRDFLKLERAEHFFAAGAGRRSMIGFA